VTIYRLYAENGNRAGFWVQHRTWANQCALVKSVEGRSEGSLPLVAPVAGMGLQVLLQLFDVRSGRAISADPDPGHRDDRNYTRIAEPCWSHGVEKHRAQLH
jgi:hypothetical protein